MKIYIHSDLEGITNVPNIDYIFTPEKHAIAAKELALDINAAVEGAFDGGADFVTVLDSHGGGGNITADMVDPRAFFDTRENKRWWGTMDESFDATFFIGAHAMAGVATAFLDHTQSSKSWYNYYVNGKKFGELAQWAMVAGHFNVPLAMVTGDEAAIVEAREFFGEMEYVAVKKAISRNFAELYDAEESRKKIYEAAKNTVIALKEGKEFKPFKPSFPAEIKLELYRTDDCEDILAQCPKAERVDGRTVRTTVKSALGWMLGQDEE